MAVNPQSLINCLGVVIVALGLNFSSIARSSELQSELVAQTSDLQKSGNRFFAGFSFPYLFAGGVQTSSGWRVGAGVLPVGPIVRLMGVELTRPWADEVSLKIDPIGTGFSSFLKYGWDFGNNKAWGLCSGGGFLFIQGGGGVSVASENSLNSAPLVDVVAQVSTLVLSADVYHTFGKNKQWEIGLGLSLLLFKHLSIKTSGPVQGLLALNPEYSEAFSSGLFQAQDELVKNLSEDRWFASVLPSLSVQYQW